MKESFQLNCENGPANGKSSWNTVKPFLSNKGPSSTCDIILCENNMILNNPAEIAETFNTFFINVASNIGADEETIDLEKHISINKIKTVINANTLFSFRSVSVNDVSKL